MNPTRDQFTAYVQAFDYFNDKLFEGKLPRCILNFSRKARSQGFFSPERWERDKEKTHEISLNPDCLHLPLIEAMDTLVHEMVHLWQHVYGQASRGGYHNEQWADKMQSIGLMPSDSGKPGGKRTGQRMSDYVIEGGPFAVAFATMPHVCAIPWRSGSGFKDKTTGHPPQGQGRVKYVCPTCKSNAWAKPRFSLICGTCMEKMVNDTGEADEANRIHAGIGD